MRFSKSVIKVRRIKIVGNEHVRHELYDVNTRVLPKVMSNFFLQANWEQQTKESRVVDGTSCCVTLECLVKSIACIT